MRVLIVDDDPLAQTALANVLALCTKLDPPCRGLNAEEKTSCDQQLLRAQRVFAVQERR